MLKLAFRNITSKPWRFIATIIAIAVVVAMSFCMLSFKGAVYDYIFATETSSSGMSAITISTNSASDQITSVVKPLEELDGVKEIVPVFKLFALLGDEYVEVRGFDGNQMESLQQIELMDGSLERMDDGAVIISKDAAEHFSLQVGDMFRLKQGSNEVLCIVGGIAQKSGYFLSDAPFQIVGYTKLFSKLVTGGTSAKLCDEIYILLEDGTSVEKTIESILKIEQYSDMLVKASNDDAYIEEKTQSLTAPVVLAGAAVLLLGIAIIVLLYGMSEGEKRTLISRLTVVGATKRQVLGIFLIESALQAVIGVLVGSALAIGVFVGLLKITLSATIAFSVSMVYLFLAGVIGFVSAMLGSLLPIFKSFKSSIRDNQLALSKHGGKNILLPIASIILAAVFVCVGALVDKVAAVMSIAGIAFSLFALAICCTPTLRVFAKFVGKTSRPSVKVACTNIVREKRFARSSVLLTLGMTIAMMLFMAWSLTTTVFTSYVSEFENMIFVSNIRANVDESEIENIDGVDGATKMVWSQATLNVLGEQKTMNVLGSCDVLSIVDFEYISSQTKVNELILSDKPYVFVDIALQKLYGINEGDMLEMTLGDVTQEVIVGGILKHELFSGNYIVASQNMLDELFDARVDTLLVVANKSVDVKEVVSSLRVEYANKNYYVVSALESFKWDMESMQAVFDLIGTLAIVVALFILGVTVASALIARGGTAATRGALLNAGMSKDTLLKAEIAEHGFTALIAFVLSMIASLVITLGLITALRLFGLYFDFMYEIWVTLTVGIVMGICYTIVPLAFNFKKGYNLKRV